MEQAHGTGGGAPRLATVTMSANLIATAAGAPGFMPTAEGLALHDAAYAHLHDGTAIEVGSYCGKSTVFLAAAASRTGGRVVTIDHHRGSEEHQPGWEYHDSELVDPHVGKLDTLHTFRRTIADAGLEEHTIAVVGTSTDVARIWHTAVNLVFIDGGHSERAAADDYAGWAPWVALGGVLLIHDVFPDPADGGRPPYHIYCRAIESGQFVEDSKTGSLRVLRRVAGTPGLPMP